jgi:single-strand DNA-binding protein
MSYQVVIIQGNVGAAPERRMTSTGKAVANFSVAVNEGKRGTEEAHTEWFRCVAWERTADVAVQYLQKGHQVLLQGRLQTRSWKDQQGMDRQTTELVVDRLTLLSNSQPQQPGYQQGGYPPPPQGYAQAPGYGSPSGYPAAPPGYPPPAGFTTPQPGYQPPPAAAAPPPGLPPAPPGPPQQGGWGAAASPASPSGHDDDIPFDSSR